MPLSIGETFAGYRIVRLLGSGGMGEVYLAEHPRLPRRDALKVLPADVSADPDYRARFIREADLASKLYHPNIVGVHDRGEHEGQLWISMDYVDGVDAGRLLTERYRAGMPVGQVKRIVTALAGALDYAHKQGLLHRDVKPANIMLTHVDDDKAEPRILLTDFGIARNVDDISGLTATNFTVGTVAYSAPEQLMGRDLDGRADEYALAATAYHLLTGSQLFPHSNPAVVISHHLNSPPPALADTHPEVIGLNPVLATALAKEPAHRFPRCSDFARAFAEEARPCGGDTSVAPTTPAQTARKSPAAVPSAPIAGTPWRAVGDHPRRRTIIVTALAAILLIGVVMVGWRALRRQHQPAANTPNSATAGPSSPTPTSPSQTVLPFSGLNEPSAVAADTVGDLYVADYNNSRILKLAPGSNTPTVLSINGINHPHGVAVDTAGALYIGDEGENQFGRVLKVVAGSSTPTVLPFTGLYGRVQVAVDARGDLFVASSGPAPVHELAAGSSTPSGLPFSQVADASGIAVDRLGNIYVSDETPHRVWKMAAGSSGPVVLPFPNIASPSAVAVDSSGSLYVTDQQNNQVMKLVSGSNSPTVVPFTNLNGPDSIAVDTTGNLYVGNVYSSQVVKLTANYSSASSNSGPPDTSTAATQPTSTATTTDSNAPALGDPCSDWDKLASDPSTGEEMVCGANTSPATQLFWIKGPELPGGIHVAGTACPGEPQYVFARSTDGYVIWCVDDQSRAFEPGGVTLEHPAGPIWALYSP